MRNFGQAVGLFLEVVGITFLTGMAIKSECDRHKAVVKLHCTECELAIEKIDNVFLKAENEHLKKQLKKHEENEEA
jgi:hypothetical protein